MKKRQKGKILPGMPEELEAEQDIPNNWIDDMVGALTDPLIIFPSPWGADIPQWCREQLSMARLIHLMKCSKGMEQWDECTDLEAMLYMFPATLEAPMSHDWAEIYVHLGYQVIFVQGLGGVDRAKYAEDMKPERDLTKDQERQLRDLKRFIHRKKVDARKARQRGEKLESDTLEREEKESKIEEHEQPTLFQF